MRHEAPIAPGDAAPPFELPRIPGEPPVRLQRRVLPLNR